jgi:hypothetical protein
MAEYSGFPFFPVEFDKNGKVHDPAQAAALDAHLAKGATTDLIVFSHGWNNDMDDARKLYANFFASARALLDAGDVPGAAGRKFAVLGVLWPSKKFADKELIPSGAAGAGSTVELDDLRDKLRGLRGVFDAPNADQRLAELEKLLPKLEDSSSACKAFVDGVRGLMTPSAGDDADAAKLFFSLPPSELFSKLQQPVSFTTATPSTVGGAAAIRDAGGAAGIGSFFSGIASGARNLVNLTTYYQMKERAGLVGTAGVNPLVAELKRKLPALRLHLVGHSFGGRLVTAVAAGASDANTIKANSLSLLQAAFSHYGLASKWDGQHDGAFRRIVAKNAISGPTIVTCTANDKAVGAAYPIASIVAGQVASDLGDENSKYGGMGRNGAQKTPEAADAQLLDVGGAYAFVSGKIHNLRADAFISDHSDITNKQVAYAVLTAIAAS